MKTRTFIAAGLRIPPMLSSRKIKFPGSSEGKITPKVTQACAAVALIGTSILLLAGVHRSQAAEIKIVSPSAYQDREGEEAVHDCCAPYRYQQVFPAEDFAALGNKPHWIVRHTWRPDESVTSPLTVQLPDQEVRLSTTQRGPNNLSSRFDDNLGSDVTEYYRGPFITLADAHWGPGPREFYHVDFPAGVTPYLYDPSQGNLLIDVIAWQGESPARADQIPGIRTSLYAESPLATRGDQGWAAIFQFTFVPVTTVPVRQLIINEGFEAPDTPTYVQVDAGQNTIAPWVVGAHSVEVADAAGNGSITGPAFEGGQFLDLNGRGRGQLTQAIATTPGVLYTLTFAYANNYYENSTAASARVRIFDALGDRLDQTITHANSVAGNYDWTVFNGQFSALQNTTTLEFTSLTDTEGNSGGILLDAVQVFEGGLKIDSITRAGNGPVVLKVRGFPNAVHRIQASFDLSAGSFKNIASVAAGADGHFQFQDSRKGLTKTYYRVVYP